MYRKGTDIKLLELCIGKERLYNTGTSYGKEQVYNYWNYVQERNGYITTGTLKEILHELDPKLTQEELNGIIGKPFLIKMFLTSIFV